MRNQFDLELHELEQSFLGLGQLVLETAPHYLHCLNWSNELFYNHKKEHLIVLFSFKD